MTSEKPGVLYVDDEVNNLVAFSAAFRKHYQIYTADSAAKAKTILHNQQIHVIISDQRMPDMKGVNFLESIIDEFPDPIRMLMTGYNDIEALIEAVNKVGIFRYITKPWTFTELKMSIDNAFEVYYTRKLLKLKTEQLEKAYNELDRFAYSASHDLRSPLTSIQGIINLAKADKREDPYLAMIETSVNKLDNFTKNIINYYRNTKLSEQVNEINFNDLVKETLEHAEFFHHSEGLHFETKVNQQQPFRSDETRIRIILNNLLSNALKYGLRDEDSRIGIKVDVVDKKAKLQVYDNGIGIEEHHQRDIFNMFYRATSEKSGSGLGLYIVKEIVHKLGGEISVKSEKGKGSIFTVMLPETDQL